MNIKTSRKLIKFGNYSLCITLPKSLVHDLDLKKGDSVSLEIDSTKKRITIDLNDKHQKESQDMRTSKSDSKNSVLNKPSRW